MMVAAGDPLAAAPEMEKRAARLLKKRANAQKHRDKQKKQLEAMKAGACVRVLTWIFLMADGFQMVRDYALRSNGRMTIARRRFLIWSESFLPVLFGSIFLTLVQQSRCRVCGQQKSGSGQLYSLPIAAGTDVLEGLAHGHQEKKFYTLHLDMLVMQMDFPKVRRLPLVDVTSVGPDGKSVSVAALTYTPSGGNNWPRVQVEGEDCCRCLDLPSSK